MSDVLYITVAASLGDDLFLAPPVSLVAVFTLQLTGAPATVVPVLAPCTGCLFRLHVAAGVQSMPAEHELRLPALELGERAGIAGLCSVLRHLATDNAPLLMGYRGATLSACGHSSPWTRFCEDELPTAVSSGTATPACVRLETHLTNRAYCDGSTPTLADIAIIPCLLVMGDEVMSHRPAMRAWWGRMMEVPGVREAARVVLPGPYADYVPSETDQVRQADAEAEDGNIRGPPKVKSRLYKRGPKQTFTKQTDVEAALRHVEAAGLEVLWLERPEGCDDLIDWDDVPSDAHPQVPAQRIQRKRAQLGSMAQAALGLARAGDVVVDFCSGGGHLGLLLAVLLPACTVVLLENKAGSLARARARGDAMQLRNVTYLQTNLEHYAGSFHVGVALHACGVASDLVLARCIAQRAAFAVCPCCYGAVSSTPSLAYPRSARLSDAMPERLYMTLAHAADQGDCKREQGDRCMAAVDADRCQAAMESDYKVSMCKMQPPTCSPKNNVIVGVPR